MKQHLVAVIYSQQPFKDCNIVGFRVIAPGEYGIECYDIGISDLVQEYAGRTGEIHGINITARGKIVATNGSFSRYPSVCNGQLDTKIVVIERDLFDSVYRISDGTSNSMFVTVEELVNKFGSLEKVNSLISNGKIEYTQRNISKIRARNRREYNNMAKSHIICPLKGVFEINENLTSYV